MPAGRPSIYSDELFDQICELLAEGNSLVSICKRDEFPAYATIMNWLVDDAQPGASGKLVEKYTRAREAQADYLAYESLDIADDASNDWMERNGKDGEPGWVLNGEHVQRSKLRVDQRKWMASKMAPKKYGDKTQTEISGVDGKPIQVQGQRIDLSQLDDEQLEQLQQTLRLALKAP